ncbi:hypothetical protein [Streptomyces sp. S1D4-20]|uniref:hypothetical protein n=1 Tax=Streptomyces sp. S1D4-20 TaxID=2594462 RepID=UPI001161F7E8|nr:hypothetical protein [Streptomyces sp. S1D4-20]QDN54015.1 hypothetical protein FNV67_00060 [Streptomyces sp. S1D4-20]
MAQHEKWTVDRLHVALPHSTLRQQLVTDVNMTGLEELPRRLEGWAGAAETLEAARPRIEAARAYVKEHGVLPPEYDDAPDMTDTVIDDAQGRRGAA